jgi:hypothetical protein
MADVAPRWHAGDDTHETNLPPGHFLHSQAHPTITFSADGTHLASSAMC